MRFNMRILAIFPRVEILHKTDFWCIMLYDSYNSLGVRELGSQHNLNRTTIK